MSSQTWSVRAENTFNSRYTYTKRGINYICNDVPADLRHHYTKLRIVQSLRTKSPIRAKHSAQSLVARLQDYWFNLRLKEAQMLILYEQLWLALGAVGGLRITEGYTS